MRIGALKKAELCK